jgi:hypothetical protein
MTIILHFSDETNALIESLNSSKLAFFATLCLEQAAALFAAELWMLLWLSQQ